MEAELDALIAEYLKGRRLNSTLRTFQEECKRNGYPMNIISDGSNDHGKGMQDELLVAFECGECEAFFKIWSEIIPVHCQQSDPTCQDLEFYLAVYFALYPMKYKIGDSQVAMQQFKQYLDSKGAILSQMQNFTIYCALPYIPDPSSHPSFRHLFTETWKQELQSRLQQYLHVTCSSILSPKRQTLLEIYYSFQQAPPSEFEILRQRLQEMQSNYHTLAEVAIELVEALEASVSGKMLNPEYIQEMCSRLFQASSVTTPQTPTIGDQPRPDSTLQASVMSLRQSLTTPRGDVTKRYIPLNYPRLKHDLLLLPNESKVLILQALRWRLTRSLPGNLRDRELNNYISNDLLGFSEGGKTVDTVLSYIMSSDRKVQEHFCRFLNSLSSMRAGRDYLQLCPTLNHTLCNLLTSLHDDSPILRNVLGTVQKLSLRHPLQSSMVSEGVLEWVITLLNDTESLSEYTLRYSLALLMNLCLRQDGKRRCVSMSPKPLHVLSELLEHENNEVRSYINGIIYSLLEVPELQEAALNMDMLELLQSAMRVSPPELQSQLEYIITRLQSKNEVNSPTEDETDEDEEGDPEIIEGDDEEEMESTENGEQVLQNYYLETSLQDQMAMPLMCPVTPQTMTEKLTSLLPHNRPKSAHGRITGNLSWNETVDRPRTSTT